MILRIILSISLILMVIVQLIQLIKNFKLFRSYGEKKEIDIVFEHLFHDK